MIFSLMHPSSKYIIYIQMSCNKELRVFILSWVKKYLFVFQVCHKLVLSKSLPF